MHLGRKAQEQGTANSQVEQINFWTLRASTMAISAGHEGRYRPRRRPSAVERGGSLLVYSYRRASTGSSFDARIAGTKPLITPTTSKTAVERITVIIEMRR
jgi:hypothetical protein